MEWAQNDPEYDIHDKIVGIQKLVYFCISKFLFFDYDSGIHGEICDIGI